MPLQIEIKTGNYRDELVTADAKHVADLNMALRSLEDGSFIVSASKKNPENFFQIEYAGVNATDNAEQRHINKCFRAVISEFITFMDKMIAIKIISEQGIPIKEPMTGEDVILKYVTGYVNDKIQEVARNSSLSNPKKLEHFTGLTPDIKSALIGYFALRRALEHHRGIPDQDIEFITLPLKIFADAVEITKVPFRVEAGQAIIARTIKENKILKKDVEICLTEKDLRNAIFTMEQVAAAEIVNIIHNIVNKKN